MTSTQPYVLTVVLILCAGGAARAQAQPVSAPPLDLFFQAAQQDESVSKPALDQLAASWQDGYTVMLVELMRLFIPRGSRADSELGRAFGRSPFPNAEGIPDSPLDASIPFPLDPASRVRRRLSRFLQQQTGKSLGEDLNRWYAWIWERPYRPHPQYVEFKAGLYANLDERMRAFFPPGVRGLIRLDEIVWGGVRVNGIPPLVYPKMLEAAAADYLKDAHVVFGMAVNGEARAYPKRILAWHEMARDRIGGREVTIVYCTLCGTVIPYDSLVGGQLRTLGTSGFLYRSNKLMFDEETLSLWSTLEGRPVVGPLAGGPLRLEALPIVTSTWGEWRAMHPETLVLSLDTGHERDYGEGVAYRDYFSTDRLMFQVPETDRRLKNKAEVLVLQLRPADNPAGSAEPLAISADFLKKNPVYHLEALGHSLVVVTTRKGANRVYRAGTERFTRRLDDTRLEDSAGRGWRVTEQALVADWDETRALPRVSAQRAFWFGWYAQFPNTRLIK